MEFAPTNGLACTDAKSQRCPHVTLWWQKPGLKSPGLAIPDIKYSLMQIPEGSGQLASLLFADSDVVVRDLSVPVRCMANLPLSNRTIYQSLTYTVS